MKYEAMTKGIFVERPNRFIARVCIDGVEELAHVKNTGRCKELLIPGATIYLEDHILRMGKRKLRYSLIAVEKGEMLINMDSQAPNEIVAEALAIGKLVLPGLTPPIIFRREQTYGSSRLDFFLEDNLGRVGYMEVKGVTLEENRYCRFPDAPTERGRKHLEELIRAVEEGFVGYVVFILQMKGIQSFRPNDAMDPAFGVALRRAATAGVVVLAYDCDVTASTLEVYSPVTVELTEHSEVK
jgi:sugar fermentation stimulation protein A